MFLVLCGRGWGEEIVKWEDLESIRDKGGGRVYYEKGSKEGLEGEYGIIGGVEEEGVKVWEGIIKGDYVGYGDGVVGEWGIYGKGKGKGILREY